MTTFPAELVEAARVSKAWPFEEAAKLVKRLEARGFDGEVLFETGYGPSGLPHIGTFGEVARTSMVRHAFRVMTNDSVPTRLLCFSDDMDGLRKVPDNVPNQEMLRLYVEEKNKIGIVTRPGTPLTSVPDPFGEHASFGAHNNDRLKKFLDDFGFEYEFASATDYYTSGRFDEALVRALSLHRELSEIVLPTLRDERRLSYSPFLPIMTEGSDQRRVVLHHAVIREAHPSRGCAVFQRVNLYTGEPIDDPFAHPVTGGNCKLQWRADWAMRWYALGVDYEMSGKDLIDSVTLASRICRTLGGKPPDGFNYELFLDDKGQKISKSKGNGLTIDEWLAYAPPESLSLFMFQKPRAAKRLYFDVIPRAVDDYYQFLAAYPRQDVTSRLSNPVWHIHSGASPDEHLPVPFSMLLNLASASNTEDAEILWGFISRHRPELSRETSPALDRLVHYAVRYYHDFVKPKKRFRAPDGVEREALAALDAALAALPEGADAESIQTAVYDVGRSFERYQTKDKLGPDGRPGVALSWFATLYELLIGQERGPRFGSFVAIYGVPETRALIAKSLSGALTATPAG